MTILISQIDAREVRSLFKGFDEDEFNTYVLEIQEFYLMPLLGAELYQDVLETPESTNNAILMSNTFYDNGSEKVSMKGIKRYLSYLFFYKFAMEGAVKYSQSGMQNYDVDFAERSPRGKDQDVISSHLGKAQAIGEEIQLFLSRNTDDYPLYQFESKIQNQDFNFRVAGETHIPLERI